jgi:Protein of unknown function (DUF1559)
MSRRAKRFLFIGLPLLAVALWLLAPCIVTVRDGEGWKRSAFNLGTIGEAIAIFHEVHGQLPSDIVGKDGAPLLSWRVALLPNVDGRLPYEEFKLDEPWDGPNNRHLLSFVPDSYRYSRGSKNPPGHTRYQGFVGPGAAFERKGLTWADFTDGRSNTLLVVEAAEPVPWTKPADLTYDPKGPLPALGGAWTKPVHFMCREVRRNPGFVACFADGSVRFIRQSVDEKVLRALITRNGGEAVDLSDVE